MTELLPSHESLVDMMVNRTKVSKKNIRNNKANAHNSTTMQSGSMAFYLVPNQMESRGMGGEGEERGSFSGKNFFSFYLFLWSRSILYAYLSSQVVFIRPP